MLGPLGKQRSVHMFIYAYPINEQITAEIFLIKVKKTYINRDKKN